MILGLLADPVLRTALLNAASREEDVLLDVETVLDAVRHGFPRMMVHDEASRRTAERLFEGQVLTILDLTDAQIAGWDADRRGARILRGREDFFIERLRVLLRERPRPIWVDHALKDLSRAAGARLPPALRSFGRRVMEFPARYDDLHGFHRLTGLSRGALKARFRRRGLASPTTYLRWFRVMAAAHVLRDPSVTTLHASHRLGYTTDGNFCRAIVTTAGITPTELRSEHGWRRLLIVFASSYLDRDALEAWASLDRLFLGRVA